MNRRALLALVASLGACAPPPAPVPPVIVAAPTQIPPVAPARYLLEDGPPAQLFALDGSAHKLWHVPLREVMVWSPLADGGVAAAGKSRTGDGNELILVAPSGEVRTRQMVPGEPRGLTARGDVVLVWAHQREGMQAQSLTTAGATITDAHLPFSHGCPEPTLGPRGEIAQGLDDGSVRRAEAHATTTVPAAAWRLPSGEVGLRGVTVTALAFFEDGVLAVGAEDGTVTALDQAGKRLWSTGLRGGIRHAVAAEPHGLLVTTQLGVLAAISRQGVVRWQHRVGSDPLSRPLLTASGRVIAASTFDMLAVDPSGALVRAETVTNTGSSDPPVLSAFGSEIVGMSWHDVAFRVRLDEPSGAPPTPEPAFVLPFERVWDRPAQGLLARGPDDVWALRDEGPAWEHKPVAYHYDGRRWSRIAVPLGGPDEEYVKGSGKENAAFHVERLAVGVDGQPWLLGTRTSFPVAEPPEWRITGAPLILEGDGHGFRDRRDLFARFSAGRIYSPMTAPNRGPASILCWGDQSAECVERVGTAWTPIDAPEVLHVDGIFRVGSKVFAASDNAQALFRRDGDRWTRVFDREVNVTAVGGTGERDVWVAFLGSRDLKHFDGVAWRDVRLPLGGAQDILAVAPDDVWVGGKQGLAHWDGKVFRRVIGAPESVGNLSITSPTDLWLTGSFGVWHTRAPVGPEPVRRLVPAAVPSEEPVTMGPAITLGEPERSFQAQRTVVRIAGGKPLEGATAISSASGATWFVDFNEPRIVEVDDTSLRGRHLRAPAPRAHFRSVYAEGPGRGFVAAVDGVYSLDHGRSTRLNPTAASPVAVGGQAGTVWSVGNTDRDFMPRALVHTTEGTRVVLGLPDATWADVSVNADGSAWLAGGLSSSDDGVRAWPAGEGLLVGTARDTVRRVRAGVSLLAVAAISPDEAWAVGAAGAIVHVRGDRIERLTLPSGVWLRAVCAFGPEEVWLGGDDATLVRFDGRAFHRLVLPGLAASATITALGGADAGHFWAAGPGAILRVTRVGP